VRAGDLGVKLGNQVLERGFEASLGALTGCVTDLAYPLILHERHHRKQR